MTWKAFGMLALLVAVVVASVWIHAAKPAYYNPFTQGLFDVVVVLLSVLSTFAIEVRRSDLRVQKAVAQSWLPAAENACKQLITISATAERMATQQKQSCDNLGCFLPPKGADGAEQLRAAMQMQCNEGAEKLRTLQWHIENAISEWEVFIRSNCQGGQCKAIFAALSQWRTRQVAGPFSAAAAPAAGTTDETGKDELGTDDAGPRAEGEATAQSKS